MSTFRLYKTKKEKSNLKYILVNNRYKKQPLLQQEEKNQLVSTIISKNKINQNIDKIKYKYGFLTNSLSQKFSNNKIQIIKNKYLKNNNNNFINSKLDINSIEYFSINQNNNANNLKKDLTSNANIEEKKKNLFRSPSLQFVKGNNILLNNFYNTLRNKNNNNLYDNRNQNKNNILNDKNVNFKTFKEEHKNVYIDMPKLSNKFKYLKNIREDYIIVDKKLRDLLNNDAFNKNRKKGFNVIFPISKKINMLSEVKRDIKNLNKKSFEDILLTPKGNGTFSSSQSSDNLRIESNKKTNLFQELFIDEKENNNIINNENEIIRPNLIKSLPKPKLEVPNYHNFCSI